MKRTLAVFGLIGLATTAVADANLEAWQAKMERRLAQLEQRVQEQDQTIREKDRQIAQLQQKVGDTEPAGTAGGWFQGLEIGGVVEVEATHTSPYSGCHGRDRPCCKNQ